MEMTIAEAAAHLRISIPTVRRQLLKGVLAGRQAPTPQGFRWVVDIEEAQGKTEGSGTVIEILREQLRTKDRQIEQLHQLLAVRALEPAARKPWWKLW